MLARFGIVRLLVKLPAYAPSVPANEEAYYPLYVRPQSLQTSDQRITGYASLWSASSCREDLWRSALIVLTAKLNDMPGWPEWQTELLQLSSNSQHLFAENSGHTIQVDEPDAAVAAIVKMVELVRQSTQK